MSERRVKVTPAEEYCPLAGEEHASIPANSKLPTPMEIKGDISQLPNVFDNVDSFPNTQGIHEKDVQKDHIAEPLSKRFNDTSPETLEDVTMENSYGIDYRSPSGSLQTYQDSTSPANQGRSVREFEEQMATLRKENFNLKLRLYFIEESIPGFQQTNSDGPETLMKQLIDTKFEMEILRKEIHEKQELLKEAAQAMNQMEKIQKETEAKGQAISEDLIRRIQMLEMEKQIEKSQDDEPVHDLIGQSDTSKNISAIQRIRELEDIVNESNEKLTDLQGQISKLDEILQKRDETVKEYEYKVKELVFQNAELLETLESKEKEVVCAERSFRGLRQSNAELKDENEGLVEALRATKDNFHQEIINMRTYERQMREQQDVLSQMQSTISIKTANTAVLLDRIQEYEKTVTKINFERNMAKRENRFFRAIIGKLQCNNRECYTIEKEEIYRQVDPEFGKKSLGVPPSKNFEFDADLSEMQGDGDYHGEYKLKKKLCVNICNSGKFASSNFACNSTNQKECKHHFAHDSCGDVRHGLEPEIPIRYTFSGSSMFSDDVGTNQNRKSCTSLHENLSSLGVVDGRELEDAIFIQSRPRGIYSSVEGVRYVYSKFGNFR